ncbi:MAG TPA: iron chelate uptake ABC transporter family permease subunit [Candidatus Methanofastidiosa archaeon]|nr:iron chelate uptake ABC transporter family permease subunit [Candidatus Methanofastidiosa archaeon]
MENNIKNKYGKWSTTIILLIIVLFISLVISSITGSAKISFMQIIRMLIHKIPYVGDGITVDWKDSSELIFFNIRLPRVILGMLIGSALAVAGTTYQAIFKNPMADPYIIGVSAGAAFGANMAILFGLGFSIMGLSPVSLFAFIGSMLVTLFVYNVSKIGRKIHIETLLLSGIAIGAFLSAMTSFMMYVAGDKLHQMVYWMMGGLWTSTWTDVRNIVIFIVVGIAIILFHSRELNLLLMGDETAQNLGVDVDRVKKILLASSSLITAFAVSVSGLIGFVGLVIPHIMRIIVGPDHRILIPTSALFGAIFLVLADATARVVLSPTEIPVGIITAFFGGPFFTYLLIKRKRSIF